MSISLLFLVVSFQKDRNSLNSVERLVSAAFLESCLLNLRKKTAAGDYLNQAHSCVFCLWHVFEVAAAHPVPNECQSGGSAVACVQQTAGGVRVSSLVQLCWLFLLLQQMYQMVLSFGLSFVQPFEQYSG